MGNYAFGSKEEAIRVIDLYDACHISLVDKFDYFKPHKIILLTQIPLAPFFGNIPRFGVLSEDEKTILYFGFTYNYQLINGIGFKGNVINNQEEFDKAKNKPQHEINVKHHVYDDED